MSTVALIIERSGLVDSVVRVILFFIVEFFLFRVVCILETFMNKSDKYSIIEAFVELKKMYG